VSKLVFDGLLCGEYEPFIEALTANLSRWPGH